MENKHCVFCNDWLIYLNRDIGVCYNCQDRKTPISISTLQIHYYWEKYMEKYYNV